MTEAAQDSSNQNYELATIQSRFCAGFVDDVLSVIIVFISLFTSFVFISHFIPSFDENFEEIISIGFVYSNPGKYLYQRIIFDLSFIIIFTIIHFLINYSPLRNGQTLGMRLMKIQAADVYGKVASIWNMYFLREIIFRFILLYFMINHLIGYNLHYSLDNDSVERVANSILRIILVVNIAFILFRDDRRCIQDFFAGTIIVKLLENEISVSQSNGQL